MRQRAALIRTLASDPGILLLDEPFSALDYQTRLNVCEDVCRVIRGEKKTALLVTHDISEAISIADRVLVLSARPARWSPRTKWILPKFPRSNAGSRRSSRVGSNGCGRS